MSYEKYRIIKRCLDTFLKYVSNQGILYDEVKQFADLNVGQRNIKTFAF